MVRCTWIKAQNNPKQTRRTLISIFNDLFSLFLCPPNCLYIIKDIQLKNEGKCRGCKPRDDYRLDWMTHRFITATCTPVAVLDEFRFINVSKSGIVFKLHSVPCLNRFIHLGIILTYTWTLRGCLVSCQFDERIRYRKYPVWASMRSLWKS